MGKLIQFPVKPLRPTQTMLGEVAVNSGHMGDLSDWFKQNVGSKVQTYIDTGKSAITSSAVSQGKAILTDPEIQALTANFVDMQIERKKLLITAFFMATSAYVAFSIVNLIRSR